MMARFRARLNWITLLSNPSSREKTYGDWPGLCTRRRQFNAGIAEILGQADPPIFSVYLSKIGSLCYKRRAMALFVVSPEKEKQLISRMRALGIQERDLEEQFVRSSGAGGQKVNKTSTCVMLHHRPTGIRVKCQKERSQALNRFLARRILLDKIEAKLAGAQSAEKQRIEKIRRQKRRRSRRTKLRLLADKRYQAEKKTRRVSVRPYNDDD